MAQSENYDKFPLWTVLLSNLLSLSVYGLGFFVMFQLGWIIAAAYLAFVIILEVRIIKNHCVDCYYWGKVCAFGKGKISSWFFQQGNTSRFCNKEMTWKDMIPDLLVFFIPLVVAVILLIADFRFIILVALILLFLLPTMGNGYIRGSLTCKYCKQRDLGCPANKLFNKGSSE